MRYNNAHMNLYELKSGTDIRGTAIEADGEKVNLSVEEIRRIGGAFTDWLARKTGKKQLSVAVGHDSRLTSAFFSDTLVETFRKCGVSVYNCGLASTPSMFAMTKHKETNCDGAVMITASHHPYHKNGLKFFTTTGGLSALEIDDILELAALGAHFVGDRAEIYQEDYLRIYADNLVAFVRNRTGVLHPLSGLKIVLDAGNGVGGFYASRVLVPLGADTSGSQFLDPDGRFPNHIPNPEDEEAMQSISACVLRNKADLGIIFDTDVDRAAIVDKSGMEINRNRLIALISAILLEENPGAYIVTDSVTSDGLKKFIQNHGGLHLRYKRGYNNVISQAKKLIAEGKNAVIAIETSGHAAFRENDFLDDGAYLVTRILIKMAELKKQKKELSDLISDLERAASKYETRILFKDIKDYKVYGDFIISDLTEFSKRTFALEPSTYEGVRVNIDYAQGWFMLRQSVHDKNMALNIESRLPDGARTIAKILYKYLSAFRGLNCPGLKDFIQ